MKRLIPVLMTMFTSLSLNAVESQQALNQLRQGNNRFVNAHPTSIFEGSTQGQSPFAVVLSCADSRVPPEIVFDQGIGSLFIVRVAGNVAAPALMDSIIFGVDALKASLIVVLGHQNCGAVNAVVTKSQAQFDLGSIFPLIEPSVEKSRGWQGNPLENAIKANVMEQVQFISMNSTINRLIQNGKVRIVGAYYHLENGEVEFLE